MEALSAKHVQSPFKRVLYSNDIKHVKVKTEERMASLMEKKIVMFTNQCKRNSFHSCNCIFFFWLHPIDNTLVVQYQLVQNRLNYVYIRKNKREKKIRMEKSTL